MNTEITFDERKQGQAIAYSGNASEVSDGCQVDLEHNGMKITAKVVKTLDGQPWVGKVTALLQADAAKPGDLQIGSTIHFQERNIFSCAA